jgi:AsmA protein
MTKMAKAAAAAARKLASTSAVKGAILGIIGMAGLVVSALGPFKVPFAETLAKTYYRQAVIGLLLVVAVMTALITAVVKLFDPNQFKDQLVGWVHERTQRDLVLEGDLRMSYFPKLGLESGKASLSQRRSAREFAALDKARITLAWLPLLRGRMHIDSAEVEGLRAQIVRFKDGTTNVDDLARDIAALTPEHFDVERLRLARSTLQWNDEITWQRGSVNELQIEIGRLADGVSSPLSASARIDAQIAGADARLQLKGRLLFDAAAGRIELARIEGHLEGKAFGVDNLTLDAKGDVTGLPRERALNADNVVISTAHKSGLTVINTAIAAPELKFGEYRLSGTSLSADASMIHPDRTSALSVKVPRFEWADRALRDTQLQAQLMLRRSDARLQARLTSPLSLMLDNGPRVELAAVQMTAGASHPTLAAELAAQLTGRLAIDFGAQTAAASWTGQLGGHDLKAEVAVAELGNRPRWTVDAECARLDLDTLLSGAWLAHLGDDATPFDVTALRDAQLQGRVRIGEVRAAGVTMSGTSTRFELAESALQVGPLAAQVQGVPLEASLRIDAGTASPMLSSQGSLGEIDLRTVFGTAARPLDARSAFVWDLTTTGASIGTLRNRLTGSVNALLHGGSLAGVDLRAALLEGRAKHTAPLAREYDAAAITPFGELKARLEFRDGRAHAQALQLDAVPLRVAGDGDLALDSGALDLRLQATVGKGAPEWAVLAGTNVPLQVQGPWRQPRFVFDFGAGGSVARAPDAGAASQAAADRLAASPAADRDSPLAPLLK